MLTYKRLAAEKGSKRLEEAFENREVLRAPVSGVVSKGLTVVVDETKIFIPASLVSDGFVKDLSTYAGKEVEFIITEFNPKKRRIIGDCKTLIVEAKNERREKALAGLSEGMTIEGTVKNVTDFGAFVDLGGIDGLLHISEMSWGRIEHPKKVFKPGEKLKVLVKEINGEKVALSLKFDDTNPWRDASVKYAAGRIVKGKVARMTDFGAFVELEPGVDALLHVSQIARTHVDKPADVLKVGQEIEAKILEFNEADKKISLSIKAILPETEAGAVQTEHAQPEKGQKEETAAAEEGAGQSGESEA